MRPFVDGDSVAHQRERPRHEDTRQISRCEPAEGVYETLKRAYLELEKESSISKDQREQIWTLFEAYEKRKRGFYDRCDMVADLYRRFCEYGHCRIHFHVR